MYVLVAIDLALDRTFSYLVPAEIAERLKVGQLLRVPFSGREARAFAMAIEDAPPEGVPPSKIRRVISIEDECPFFSPPVLKLVKWIAQYTAAPIETCLKAAVPAAVLKPSARAKELLYVESAPEMPAGLTKRQQELVCELSRVGGGWMSQVVKEFSTCEATIRALEKKGAVTIEKRAARRNPLAGRRILPTRPMKLNDMQRAALAKVIGSEDPVLLFGVTGSGKTEVYLQAIAAELEAGRGAIVLVPEIALTPQTVSRFAGRFGSRVAVLHSALSDGERYDEWHRIRTGEARVVVGPRSAVFAPVRDLGLIVVDEEHDTSYKQEETPRYHARDVAVMRARFEGCRVVLGSATPSLETWYNARRGKYAVALMPSRVEGRELPSVTLVDMEDEMRRTGRVPIFSQTLLDAISARLARGEQSILFLNRRGYARVWTCSKCGWVASCPRCSGSDARLPYTYHRHDQCLRCHICGAWEHLPDECPECHSREFSFSGIGTQRAEDALSRCFPQARILRMDADSTSRKASHDDILSIFRTGKADILLGTQMIAKGLDFPNVTLVGVLNADTALNLPDFRASERTYQLLQQVAGRAGRAEKPGEVVIQTFQKDAPAVKAAAGRAGYAPFAEAELKARKEGPFPPWCRFATLLFKSRDAKLAGAWCTLYAKSLANWAGAKEAASGVWLKVSEAQPAALEEVEGWHRWQLSLRAEKTSTITSAYRWIVSERPPPQSVRIALDVDALNLL